MDFYFLKVKYVMEAFWKNKKVKVVELSQFKSFENLSIIFKTLKIKVKG
jgi:hypothetical protein